MNTGELQALTVKELQKFAGNLGSSDFPGLRKQDLIKEILEIQAKKKDTILLLRIEAEDFPNHRAKEASYPGRNHFPILSDSLWRL